MLIYEFQCIKCCEVIEKKDNENNVSHCGYPMQRIYGVAAIHFKGSGFYTNDKK